MIIEGIFQVMIANILSLVLNFLNSFMLPKYLSIDSYAMLKTFTLYMMYAGLLHFGFNDGIHLKYGGKKIRDIQRSEIDTYFKSFLTMEFSFALIVAATALLIHDQILLFFSIGFTFSNFIDLLQNLYQATGEFKNYGRSLNAQALIVLAFNIVLIFVFRINNYFYFVTLRILVSVIVALCLTIQLNQKYRFMNAGSVRLSSLVENIRTGFVLMLGNLTGLIFTSIDRWFVKILLLTVDFAQYSFAVSIDVIVNTFIKPITVTLYNQFCISREEAGLKRAKNILLIWALFVIAAGYPAKLVIILFLSRYSAATEVMFFLLASQAFAGVVKGIYVNFYKAEKKQDIYFKQTVIMILLSVVTNVVFYLVMRNMQSFAIATLATNIIWLLVCEATNKQLRFEFRAYVFCTVEIVLFILTGMMCDPVIGLVLYLASLVILTRLMMADSFFEIVKIVNTYGHKFIGMRK